MDHGEDRDPSTPSGGRRDNRIHGGGCRWESIEAGRRRSVRGGASDRCDHQWRYSDAKYGVPGTGIDRSRSCSGI